MAKFNGNIFKEEFTKSEEEMKKCIVFFQECLSKDEYEKIKSDWHNSDKNIPFWKYVFDNVKVTYIG